MTSMARHWFFKSLVQGNCYSSQRNYSINKPSYKIPCIPLEVLSHFKQSKNHNTKITQAVYLQLMSHIIMIVIALNDIIAFPNLDLTFDNPCANWSLKALLCNNLSHRNKGSPIMAARLPSWIAFASVKRTTVVSHLVWKSGTNYAQAGYNGEI